MFIKNNVYSRSTAVLEYLSIKIKCHGPTIYIHGHTGEPGRRRRRPRAPGAAAARAGVVLRGARGGRPGPPTRVRRGRGVRRR